MPKHILQLNHFIKTTGVVRFSVITIPHKKHNFSLELINYHKPAQILMNII